MPRTTRRRDLLGADHAAAQRARRRLIGLGDGLRDLESAHPHRVRRDVGCDDHRAQHRDADFMHFQFAAQRLGEPHHRELRRAVDTEPRHPDEPRHRRGIEHVAALLLLDHARRERFDAVHDAPEVDVHREPPVVGRHLQQRAGDCDAGVVADEMRGAEVLEDAVGEGVHAGALGHVGARRRAPRCRARAAAWRAHPSPLRRGRRARSSRRALRTPRPSRKPMPPAPPVITATRPRKGSASSPHGLAARLGSLRGRGAEDTRRSERRNAHRGVCGGAVPASRFEAARSSTAR